MARAFWSQLSQNRDVQFAQSSQAAALNPLLRNPITNGIILENVALLVGSNTIQHKLDRKLQGWVVVRKGASAEIYDTQDTNTTPDRTLVLVSNAVVTVNLYVF